jgi:enoyl-CoA hydratase/carnithine racemase
MKIEQHTCIWEKSGSIGILALNNPPENLIEEPEFITRELLNIILNDTDLKGIIIKGAGRHFSAGADMEKLKTFAQNHNTLSQKISKGKDIIHIIDRLNIPVVAAISGVCFGAGLEIALACHIRMCSENALFAFPEINYGFMPGMGGTVMLSRLVGIGKSAEIILSGELVNANKALEIRLADQIVPKNDLHAYSLSYLTKMTEDREVDVIHSVMQSIHNSQVMSFENALEEETRLFCALAIKSMQEN